MFAGSGEQPIPNPYHSLCSSPCKILSVLREILSSLPAPTGGEILLCTATRSPSPARNRSAAFRLLCLPPSLQVFSRLFYMPFITQYLALPAKSLICFVITPDKINGNGNIPEFQFNPWSREQFTGLNQVLTIASCRKRRRL